MTLITFEHAREIIESQSKRGLDKKKLANNTYLMKSDCFVIQLHNTNIIKIYPNDIYELNTEGWQTVTTKDRLNEFSPADIYQKRGVWFVKDNNADKEDKVFFDGIRISKSGEILNSDSAPSNLIERKKRLDRMVSKYIRGFAKDAIDNGLRNPSSGDCFFCQLFSENDKDHTHIYSHLQEDYFVPSLLFNAIKERGYRDPVFIWAMIKSDAEQGKDGMLKSTLRSFFSKRKNQLVKLVSLN
jgi:hypothetical protein